jgi:hypothetical protein
MIFASASLRFELVLGREIIDKFQLSRSKEDLARSGEHRYVNDFILLLL